MTGEARAVTCQQRVPWRECGSCKLGVWHLQRQSDATANLNAGFRENVDQRQSAATRRGVASEPTTQPAWCRPPGAQSTHARCGIRMFYGIDGVHCCNVHDGVVICNAIVRRILRRCRLRPQAAVELLPLQRACNRRSPSRMACVPPVSPPEGRRRASSAGRRSAIHGAEAQPLPEGLNPQRVADSADRDYAPSWRQTAVGRL